MGIRPFLLISEPGLKVKLGQKWSQHVPNKAPKLHLPFTWALDHVYLNLEFSKL